MAHIVVFGSINVDLVSKVAHIARPGETVLSPSYDTHFGGKGANQAVAAAHAARGHGLSVAMLGAVGRDAFGDQCLSNMDAAGVDIAGVQRSHERTGVAFISVDAQAENAITVASGANRHLSAGAVPQAACLGARAAVLQMEVPMVENLAFAQGLPDETRLIFNFAPAEDDTDPVALKALLSRTDIFVVNEHEAEVAGRIAGDGAHDFAQLATALGLDLVVTKGGAGVDLFARDGRFRHFDAPKVDVVDTTGAGDLFTGTLAARIAGKVPLDEAIAAACNAASIAVTRPGAQVDVFA
ncbi:PfkB family carbohydrate kinase [Aureimonas frigidaquae]|uniref:Ribokinase n=1 Tax=Aureimonas frigidaquae TaxID=424757 RepID=A0A0P0Z352_9HYPH|nr:PfkB family carbohydrate kinase [Aureimonas frigidaquae]BAT28454.1 PfkB domain protein [Aureimonas frigidaquae]